MKRCANRLGSVRSGVGVRLALALVLALGAYSCSSSSDGTSAPDDVRADTPGDAGVDGTSPQNPSVSFVFEAAGGDKGLGAATVTLTAADEPEAYKGQPDFQIDIRVETRNVENGRPVTLTIGNAVFAPEKVALGADGLGVARFEGITLSHNLAGVEVKVEVTDQAGASASSSKKVIVDTGFCGVSLLPPNTKCLTADIDPDTPGVQVRFTVVNPDGTCDNAKLVAQVSGAEKVEHTAPLDASGQAVFTVTVSSEANADGLAVQVTASVEDSTNADRTGVTNAVSYTVDNVAPTVLITEPAANLLSAADDLDGDPKNGIQAVVAGSVDGLPSGQGGELTASLGTTVLGTTQSLPDGLFSFGQLTFADSGAFTLTVTAEDACGNVGESSKALTVVGSIAELTVMTPPNHTVLFAKDDGDPDTANSYEITFSVRAVDLVPGYELAIECAEQGSATGFIPVGTALVTETAADATYEVPAVLDRMSLGPQQSCRARYDAPTPSISAPVELTVALPAPKLVITSPAFSPTVGGTALEVLVTAKSLDGKAMSVRILDAVGVALIDRSTAEVFVNGGMSTSVLLETDGGVPLPDGSYTLEVEAADDFGNLASDNGTSATTAPFTLDRTPPGLSLLAPSSPVLDPAANPAHADTNPSLPGYQTLVRIGVSGESSPELVQVCIQVNGGAESCSNANTSGEASFADITLQPGSNSLVWRAVDGAGNEVKPPPAVITLVLDAPRVAILQPEDGAVTIADTVDVTMEVKTAAGDPILGATLALTVNGGAAGGPATDLGGGSYRIDAVPLGPGSNAIQVSATLGGKTGWSPIHVITRKSGLPVVDFAFPSDGAEVVAGDPSCKAGLQDCELVVDISITNLEDGSAATLDVDCGAGPTAYAAVVAGGSLRFTKVLLSDQATCTLSAKATDLAGQVATAGPISVVLDRVRPVVLDFTQPSTTALITSNDLDPDTAGMQTRISVRVQGIEAGQSVTVDFLLEGVSQGSTALPAPADIPDDQSMSLTSETVTLPDGDVTLRAVAADKIGNVSVPLTKVVQVFSQKPLVQIEIPADLPPTACAKDSECGGGLCASGSCAIGWSALSNRSLTVLAQGIPESANNLRICSDHAGVTGAPCQSAGFKVVATSTLFGPSQAIGVGSAPDGVHRFIAEARISDTAPWVSSLDGPDLPKQQRRILIDTGAPTVTSLGSPSDTDAPLGVLNLAERVAAGGAFVVRIQSSEPGGSAEIFVDGQKAASGPLDADRLDATVTLSEGPVEIYGVVRDRVGNASAIPPSGSVLFYSPTVDTIPPSLLFDRPTTSPLLAKDKPLDVELSSDAIGATVTLLDSGLQVAQVPVASDGKAVFLDQIHHVLTDGTHTLTAQVADSANNVVTATTSPPTLVVDTTGPGVKIVDPPATPTVLGDGDDAQPTVGGFQVRLEFSTEGAKSWVVIRASGCSAAYAGCVDTQSVASGAVANPGGAEPAVFVTLPISAKPHHQIEVRAIDDNGNQTVASVQIQVNLTSCTASFAGFPSGGAVGNAICPTPGSDCDSVAMDMKVVFVGPCGGLDSATIYRDGSIVAGPVAVVNEEATLSVTLNHGTSGLFSAKGFASGSEVADSGGLPLQVDLHDPLVDFVSRNVGGFDTPTTSTTVTWGLGDDQAPLTADLQVPLVVLVDDDSGSASVVALESGGAAVPLVAPALPAAVPGGQGEITLQNATLAHADGQVVTVRVRDDVGNEAEASFTANVDVVPPASPTLVALTPDKIDRRLPSVTLDFDATADDGSSGPAASFYDLRYARTPILDEADFTAACAAAELPGSDPPLTPAAPGVAETYTLAGPDPKSPLTDDACRFVTSPAPVTWYFAVRAVDDAGNGSAIVPASTQSSADLVYRYLRVIGTGANDDPKFHRNIQEIGDLDGDGKGDFALGGVSVHRVCVIYGRAFADGTASISVPENGDANSDCFAGQSGGHLGYRTVNLGDINGDLKNDLAIGQGNFAYDPITNPTATPPREVRIHFGDATTGRPGAAPLVIIRGMRNFLAGNPQIATLDFNGDGLMDIAIGAFLDNKVYIIPGRSDWPPANPTIFDLQNASHLTTLQAITVELTDAVPNENFGRFLAGGGNILSDAGTPQYDELLVVSDRGPSQIFVVTGRAGVGPKSIKVSNDGTSAADDASSLRLRSEAGGEINFGQNLHGGVDLTGDGVPDVVADHRNAVPDFSIFVFDGAKLDAATGPVLKIDPSDASPVGQGLLRGANGVILTGDLLRPQPLPPMDDAGAASPTWELGMTRFEGSSSQSGEIYVRLNIADGDKGFQLGHFPWRSVVLQDPDIPGNLSFGIRGVIGVPDFNDDGFNDLIIGVEGSNGAVLVY